MLGNAFAFRIVKKNDTDIPKIDWQAALSKAFTFPRTTTISSAIRRQTPFPATHSHWRQVRKPDILCHYIRDRTIGFVLFVSVKDLC